MKRRMKVAGGGGAPTDLLFCFPSTAHLALTPKHVISPSRPAHLPKRHPTGPSNRRPTSPLFCTKNGNHSGSTATAEDVADEPTSPTVTCAGQIKIRPRSISGRKITTSSAIESKRWLAVMEEMERHHRHSKKPFMDFFTALRSSLRFDLRCFGSFHGARDCATHEEEEEEEEEGVKDKDLDVSASENMFSKWFFVSEKNQSHGLNGKNKEKKEVVENIVEEEEEAAPPPNALLLMRCRSAPAKGEGRTFMEDEEEGEMIELKSVKEKKDTLFPMSNTKDFMKFSPEIAKETWVAGKFDSLARSQSWKR